MLVPYIKLGIYGISFDSDLRCRSIQCFPLFIDLVKSGFDLILQVDTSMYPIVIIRTWDIRTPIQIHRIMMLFKRYLCKRSKLLFTNEYIIIFI